MKKIAFIITIALLCSIATALAQTDTQNGENAMLSKMRQAIPADRIRAVDELHEKWQQIQNGQNKAMLIDLRTEAEFDSGHIKDSNYKLRSCLRHTTQMD